MKNAMQLKALIKNFALDKEIMPQAVLQNYMLERLLERMSRSQYKDKFILKGGMLIAALIGIDIRTTMDMDATLKNMTLTKESVTKAIIEIIKNDEEMQSRWTLYQKDFSYAKDISWNQVIAVIEKIQD